MKRSIAFFVALFAIGSLVLAGPAFAQDKKGRSEKPKKADEEQVDDDDADDEDSADDEADEDADVAKKDKKDKVNPVKRLIEVRIDQTLVPARAINIPLPGRTKTVRELLERFDRWGKDDEVGAILLNLDGLGLSLPDVEQLRVGVLDLRKTGKRVVSFLNSGDPESYLLACATDEIAMAPTGSLAIPGLGRVFPFMRGMYQLQGVEFDVITAGKFKYPGFMNQREPNKYFTHEFEEILDSWFGDYVGFIAKGRKLSEEAVKKAIDVALFDAQEAKQRGLIDTIAYYDEFCDRTVRRYKYKKSGEDDSDFSKITSLQDLLTTWSKEVKKAQDSYKAVGPKIAVLHARGPIVDMNLGPGFSSSLIMRDEFVKSIEEIRKNKTIRAVVLAVDSPGGSGYASDVIWRHLRALDEEKPLVVSMGSVAGSGGYYIACPGRLIFAEPTTITGSIGVLAILANQASAINRMDVNVSEMKRGARALFGSGHRDMLPEDRDFLQKYILDFYEIFLDRVATGRKMPKNEVRKLAEGRIYTGRQALELGLVDRLGGLKEAIAAVREIANIPTSAEIKLVHYPRPSTFGELVESFAGVSAMTELATKAQSPAVNIGFDQQLRFFATSPRPMCWMAIPELCELLRPATPAVGISPLMSEPAPLQLQGR
jgi:protease-4